MTTAWDVLKTRCWMLSRPQAKHRRRLFLTKLVPFLHTGYNRTQLLLTTLSHMHGGPHPAPMFTGQRSAIPLQTTKKTVVLTSVLGTCTKIGLGFLIIAALLRNDHIIQPILPQSSLSIPCCTFARTI